VTFHYTRHSLKQFDRFPPNEQLRILQTDEQVKTYLLIGKASYGLRIKHLGRHTYEARVSDRVRMVWVWEGAMVTFALVGSHDEVRRFIRRF
jgi:hypothetical protein